MASPERPRLTNAINSRRSPQPEHHPTLNEIECQLEAADEIENIIEREAKREELLELLDILEEETSS